MICLAATCKGFLVFGTLARCAARAGLIINCRALTGCRGLKIFFVRNFFVVSVSKRLSVSCSTFRTSLGSSAGCICIRVIGHILCATNITVVILVTCHVEASLEDIFCIFTVITNVILVVFRILVVAHISLAAVAITLMIGVFVYVIKSSNALGICSTTATSSTSKCLNALNSALRIGGLYTTVPSMCRGIRIRIITTIYTKLCMSSCLAVSKAYV